ncbi:MAG: choice-of-anchor D domain-containing protein [Candidatus Kapaibacterium sp.]
MIYKYIIPIFFLIFTSVSSAQLQLQIEEFSPNQYVRTENFPLLEMRVYAAEAGQPVQLDISELLVVENNISVRPSELVYEGNGWHDIKWIPGVKGWDPSVNYATLVVTRGTQSAAITGIYPYPDPYLLALVDQSNLQIDRINFGKVAVGDTARTQTRVVALLSRTNSAGNEMPFWLDSISFSTEHFAFKWHGNNLTTAPPPVLLQPAFSYYMDILFVPKREGFIQDVITFHYQGGITRQVRLTGNEYKIERQTLLKLVQPDSAVVLAPCQKYEIKWTGHSRSIPTHIFASYDGGLTWDKIESSMDSTYLWTVPDVETDRMLIKVRQDMIPDIRRTLVAGEAPVAQLAYNHNATRLLAADQSGKITEFNLMNDTKINEYIAGDYSYPDKQINPFGLGYTNPDHDFILTYDPFSIQPRDTIAFFENGASQFASKKSLEAAYKIRHTYIDPQQRFIAMVPALNNQLKFIDPADGSEIETIIFDNPVIDFAFNQTLERAVVALLNGDFVLIDLPNFGIIKTMNFPSVPVIERVAYSPDGKLLGLGSRASRGTVSSGASAEINIIDIDTEQIVRTNEFNATDPLGLQFDPASNMLVVGSRTQPQIAFWDLPADVFAGTFMGAGSDIVEFELSPEGHSIAFGLRNGAVVVRSFTYPEEDQSNGYNTIARPAIATEAIVIEPKFIATTNNYTYTGKLCNAGISKFIFTDVFFLHGEHFAFGNISIPDTLEPGECLTFDIAFRPRKIGKITDSLVFESCGHEYIVPLHSEGLARNITFLQNDFNFGDVCIGDTAYAEFELFRNEDPVPLEINSLISLNKANTGISVAENYTGTVVPPGGVHTVRLRFIPPDLGVFSDTLAVYHSEQMFQIFKFPVSGRGIGTFVDMSHQELLYIPEITTRYLTITNTGGDALTINQVNIAPVGNFRVTTPMPVSILPGETDSIAIEWFGGIRKGATLSLDAVPCLVQKYILLDFFEGASTVSIPTTEADPRGNAIININYENRHNRDYAGERFCEAEFSVNPRLFLPETVESDHGQATITRNEIVGDERIVGIRVEGDFPRQGTLARVIGPAGIAETDRSPLQLQNGNLYWGEAVDVTPVDGELIITGLCGDRRILQNDAKVSIVSLMPNPASGVVNVVFDSETEDSYFVEIYDELGQKVLTTSRFSGHNGRNEIGINLTGIAPGTFRLMLRSDDSWSAEMLVIIK